MDDKPKQARASMPNLQRKLRLGSEDTPMNAIHMRLYLAGYGGWEMPRSIRRLIARTEFHRAWFLGFNGFFEQDGISYGLVNPYPGDAGKGCGS